MNWLYYLAEANIYLGIFYLAYCLFLNRDTHYQLSRAYLLTSCIIAFILPVLQIGVLRPVKITPVTTAKYVTVSPPVNIITQAEVPVINTITNTPVVNTPVANTTAAPVSGHHLALQDVLWYTYITGAAIFVIVLLVKLFALFRMTGKKEVVRDGKYRVIYLSETNIAFSFFNYLFIGEDTPEANTIITHEMVHIRQKHSADIVFLELLKVINWFNPLIYILQNSLKTVHEYIADEQTAAQETDVLTYASFLVKNAYGVGSSSITHSFFNYNLLKKRIIMLNQQRSGNLARLKYLVAIPICAALLCSSTLVFSKSYGWVDLVPAHLKATGKYAMLNSALISKRKRLKVTQNGVTTITDKLAVNNGNKKVVYTAGTITAADKSALAKDQHIKVEVVTDSTEFTTKDGRPMLPVVGTDGYYFLDHYLHKNIHYTTTKGEKGGRVVVEITLDNDRHISAAKIAESGGAKLDALALNGFNSYKGIVNDDPGKKLKLTVYFFTNDYSIFKTDSLGNDPEFGGELIITNYKYPISVTSKGYEYDASNGGGFGGPGGNKNGRVVIYEKNGEGKWFYQDKCTLADLQMLKDKYGYTFPTATSFVLEFMHPANVNKSHLAYAYTLNSYLDAPYTDNFYQSVTDNMQYPEEEKKSHTGGVVVLNFNLDNDKMIRDVTVAQSGGKDFDEAAINALQSYKTAINDNAGNHSIAIVFCVANKKYRPVVSESVKKDGYVGELAVAELKSPFRFVAKK
jgi:TonB family protein